jgi:hypothetical protein
LHPGIFFGLTLFFGIFFLAGSGANMIIIYVVGLTGMGAFTVLTGLTISKWSEMIKKSFETDKNFPILIVKGLVILAGFGMLLGSIDYWRDVPLYNNKKFSVLSGKPSEVDVYKSKGTITGLYVTIRGKTLDIDADIRPGLPTFNHPNELKEKYFTIRFLPHSNWIIDYKIE